LFEDEGGVDDDVESFELDDTGDVADRLHDEPLDDA